jgi:hypothetical protein
MFACRTKAGVQIVNEGSCNCGAVRFALTTTPSTMGTCHCSRCRKAGASTIVFVKREELRWIQGKEQVAVYKPDAPYKYERCFCKVCGTSLGEILSNEASFPISANALDFDPGIKVQFHEYVTEKPSWIDISDKGAQHESAD